MALRLYQYRIRRYQLLNAPQVFIYHPDARILGPQGGPAMKQSGKIPGLVIVLVLAAVTAGADNGFVAVTDGFDATVVNPAALSVGNASGIAGKLGYSGSTFGSKSDFGESWAFFLTSNNLAYAFEELPGGSAHTLAASARLAPGFHAGTSYRWSPGELSDGMVSLGALFRPADVLSTGATVAIDDEQTVTGVVGLGVRPLFFYPRDTHRLTLSGDIPYDGSEWTSPRIGVGAEPVDGLNLQVGYEIETGLLSAEVSLALTSARAGNRTRFDADNEADTGSVFLHLSPRRFRSLFAPRDTIFIDYSPGPVVVERRSFPEFGPLAALDDTVSALSLAREIRRMAGDKNVDGILFYNHLFSASPANMLEIQAALQEFRAAGKRVVFYYEGVDNRNYALAAATADRIFLHPGGFVYLTGDYITRPYVKELLDSIGVEVRNFTSGEYKDLGNIFSESGMTEAEREALEYFLDGLQKEFLRTIDEGRGDRLAKSARDTVDAGPYLVARDALEAGLVDRLLYRDQLLDALEPLGDRPQVRQWESRKDIRYSWAEVSGAKVALVYVSGPITTGRGRIGEVAGSDAIAAAIRRAREDSSVEAVLLRVASGGGSSLASDTIAREIWLTRFGEDAKPVVVSMGGSAASGGYYVSVYADEIIAQPTTVTGSIGVVSLVPNIAGLSDRLGITWETVRRGERADLGAFYRSLEPEETRLFQYSVDEAYGRFVATVAEGRGMPEEDVREVAAGRIWTGAQARDRGLVDALGGLYTAIDLLEEKLGKRIDLVEYTGYDGLWETSTGMGSGEFARRIFTEGRLAGGRLAGSRPAGSRVSSDLTAPIDAARVLELFGDERVLYLAPHQLGR